ncbi:hypothetical protein JCM19294_2143 [Nonlabens tegetincola]|uniref:Gliding motility protein GldM n=2 Tax=Nonlabens tegetincola TaxID=323273 RepID=A0A090Q0T6_9FLAO|nr:gliding motility protein GldM [Nonlabens tegetincola]GAK96630.1 hypothetical protein JCM19294_2143 [Nonlabens tegetincola]
MAGGKQSPRQKMINLMYLVFIAMLALNMSKEVLSAFGLINENLQSSNVALAETNKVALEELQRKSKENAKQYEAVAAQAQEVDAVTNEYYEYLESVKAGLIGSLGEGIAPNEYETQDKSDYLNEKWFNGDNYTKEGQAFLDNMTKYRSDMKDALGEEGYEEIFAELDKTFNTDPVKNKDGIEVKYLNYHYEGYPLIASRTKLTLLQNEIRNIQSKVTSKLLQGELIQIASANNYEAIVSLDKNAFFNGEKITGKVVLGRYDDTTVPNKVIINGRELSKDEIKNGQIPIDFAGSGVGEKEITGEMQFVEGDSTIVIPIKGEYAVIPKPNSATISADKMNVVYRGVDNPMTITFAGVPNNNVRANAPGLVSKGGSSYIMSPGAGKEVKINVSATLASGETVSDSKTFRIKNLPRPTGMVAGEYDDVKKGRQQLAISDVDAKFLNFDFELKPRVTSFIFKVPGQPAIPVSGNRLNGAAKSALNRARKGDIVQFAKIKAAIPGVKVNLPGVSSVAVELTN